MMSQFTDLTEFLARHNTKNIKDETPSSPTHTRIGDKNLNVYGASFVILPEVLPTFYQLYYTEIFVKKKMEYLTEKQIERGAILIDLDFRYSHEVTKRQHTKSQIQDLLNLIYLETLKEFFIFEVNKPFNVYVMEKPNVNRLEDGTLTKDGIHIIIGIQMDHFMQQMLRERVLTKIHEIWDLPLINDWPSVLDEGISKGTTNWQLYGSRKPGNQAYELTQFYTISYDNIDGEFMMDERKVSEADLSNNFCKISAQYPDHPQYEINPKIKAEYEKRVNMGSAYKIKKNTSKTKLKLLLVDNGDNDNELNVSNDITLEDIKSPEVLRLAVDNIINSLKTDEYDIKEMHEYTQILPEKYYEPGSHLTNRLVAFALKHTDERLFLSWIMLRSKASDFDYNTIPSLYASWKKFKDRPDGVTKRSIMYWAKQDAYEDYMKVKLNTLRHFIELTISSPFEFDFAMALKYMFKDKYVCTSITGDKWYVFKNHRWVPDLGQTLRLAISKDMFNVYAELQDTHFEELQKVMNEYDDPNDEAAAKIKSLNARGTTIASNLIKMKKSAEKDKIMREAAPLFYDGEFATNMDSNKYLMCFINGVIDFKSRTFRDGYPQDYITKSTNIAYVPFNMDIHSEQATEINAFLSQLFPIPELNKYMWDHLASSLIGENINQTFNIYRGSGSNGKSMLTDLMSHTLGEYKGSVPITLVTDKRNSIGGTSSEVMQLKGVRYAVMQEPSKDMKINEGVMKELTGGDPIQARALYCESETFTPQFSLVVCTNNLFQVDSNDDGTWRRFRICDFMAKFVDANTPPSIEENPYQFPKDKNLKEKIPKWAPVFASMLVKRAFETQGIVEQCDIVMASSNKYRQGQDHIAAFISENVIIAKGDRIKKRELCEQFKLWFQDSQGSRKMPKGVELCEYMNLKYGICKKNEWMNVKLVYETNNITSEDMEEEN